jgi:hypothetical protein
MDVAKLLIPSKKDSFDVRFSDTLVRQCDELPKTAYDLDISSVLPSPNIDMEDASIRSVSDVAGNSIITFSGFDTFLSPKIVNVPVDQLTSNPLAIETSPTSTMYDTLVTNNTTTMERKKDKTEEMTQESMKLTSQTTSSHHRRSHLNSRDGSNIWINYISNKGIPSTDNLIPVGSMLGKNVVNLEIGHSTCHFVSRAGDVYSLTKSEDIFSGSAHALVEPQLVNCLLMERVLYGERILKISCRYDHAMVVSDRGHVFTWGKGLDGRLGHGDDNNVRSPQLCMALVQQTLFVVDVAAGGTHSMCVDKQGRVYSWGDGSRGEN